MCNQRKLGSRPSAIAPGLRIEKKNKSSCYRIFVGWRKIENGQERWSFIQNLLAFQHSTRLLETFNHKFLSEVDNTSISASQLSSWRHGSYTPFYLTHSWFEPNHNSFIHRCIKKLPHKQACAVSFQLQESLKKSWSTSGPTSFIALPLKTPLQDLMADLAWHSLVTRQNWKENRNFQQNIICCKRSHHVRNVC